ncbi:MAG: DNA (cytosine-5-)-methyltransferase [Spirochaetales bacterium]|nr:DNA (cytosine-5-)-methyltransferase [Spirochaetales bacterium]
MKTYSIEEFAQKISVSKETLRRWDNSGHLSAERNKINGYRFYTDEHLRVCEQLNLYFPDDSEPELEKPFGDYSTIELFAGAGGLALGLEQAGLHHVLLNEFDKWACSTLRRNRPEWNVVEGDIRNLDFRPYFGKIDVVTGGFPCQAFSYAGKKLGFDDARGTLFFEYARAIKEIKPKICIAENVRGLLSHENGKTLNGMIDVLEELGYRVLPYQVLKAIYYRVPQKRERLVLVAIRNDISIDFTYPKAEGRIFTLRDALKAGELYDSDVPESDGQKYPKRKKEILDLVPPGGYWRDLPLEIQKEYMLKSFYLGGGKTGMARRISWDEPSLTLTCAPAQKQTERCHPEETRPFTVREYARIQTFPDDWIFEGSMSQQYKQIGNAVPVNLATAVGHSVVRFLNEYYQAQQETLAIEKVRAV